MGISGYVQCIMAMKMPKKFSVRNCLRKTARKGAQNEAQNDEEPQPLKKHQKSKIMNKEGSNRFISY